MYPKRSNIVHRTFDTEFHIA
uniref:Uncharacterized protein n=1 Tax=Arundo donax TaxID=35708 RepID=A0A0A9C3J0_ARUDO